MLAGGPDGGVTTVAWRGHGPGAVTRTGSGTGLGPALRHGWVAATVAATVVVTVTLSAFGRRHGAPTEGALFAVVLVGGAVHVAATGWFYTVPAVREHARSRWARYYGAPLALVAGAAALVAVLPGTGLRWLLLVYFGWQFFHYQKQNVGLCALAGASHCAAPLTQLERRCVLGAGIAGTAALLARPALLGLGDTYDAPILFAGAAALFAAIVVTGFIALALDADHRRSPAFVAMYGTALAFFTPVFLFDAPFAAAGSFAVAHGFQYLILVGLVAGAAGSVGRAAASLAALLAIAALGGWALYQAQTASLVDAGTRALFGAYLGLVMAHFVVDGAIWRLRDEFPRRFLGARLPYLLRRAG